MCQGFRYCIRGSLCRVMPLGLLLATVLSAFSPGAAAANRLAPVTVAGPVKLFPGEGGWDDGNAEMSVDFPDTNATATASAASVGLGPGHVFHVDTCIKAHSLSPSFAYSTTCQAKTVDTTGNSASIWVPAPTATATMARPAAGASAYFSFIVSISERRTGDSFSPVGSSWPSAGLTGASVAGPSLGASTAPAP